MGSAVAQSEWSVVDTCVVLCIFVLARPTNDGRNIAATCGKKRRWVRQESCLPDCKSLKSMSDFDLVGTPRAFLPGDEIARKWSFREIARKHAAVHVRSFRNEGHMGSSMHSYIKETES